MYRFGEMYEKRGIMEREPWVGKMRPFRIVGGVYFVGTYQASCHLIDTGAGLIMIDPGYTETAYLVLDSIYKLGFKPEDIKYIINTHWHYDHTEATRQFADLSGAKCLIGTYDAERASKYFTPDGLIGDGDRLELGNTVIEFMHTPGHTRGTVSFFFDAEENERVYRVGMFGGVGFNTLADGCFDFDGCREAYAASLERLKAEQVDVMLGNHTWNNGTYCKSLELLSGGENRFIDPEMWGRFITEYSARLKRLIGKG